MTFTHVHTPLQIGPVTVPNRVFRSAHGTNLGQGTMSDDLIAYHLARARGGVGLTILEILSIHPTTAGPLNIYTPGIDAGYAKLVEAVRPTGMRLFQQLWHAGHHAAPADGSPPWSASDVPGPQLGIAPIAMTKAMIDEIVGAYASAAARCAAWGLDGVEVHGAHGYLIHQFLGTTTNRRTDDYGGSFENRARFMLELMAAVRGAVGREFAVGIRVAPDLVQGGIGIEETLASVAMLEARGLIDFVNVSVGNYQSFPKMIGGMHEPVGYELPHSAVVTAAARVPRLVIGRFRTLEEADSVIRGGEADMVGFTRATIADPDLVRKTLAGRPDEVRPCIACNQGCVGQLLVPPYRLGCVVNAAAGFERSLGDDRLVPATSPMRVWVVGGGPAGMEAARVAALRGHSVTLVEAAPMLGGALRLAARAPTRHGIFDIAAWQEAALYRLGVDVRLSTPVDPDDIAAAAPDEVIVATGSTPRMDGVQLSNPGEPVRGIDGATAISSHTLFAEPDRDRGRTAVVIDDAGHYEGIAAAEHLVARGIEVAYVSRHVAFAPLVESALMTEPALERLARGRFTMHLRTRAIEIDDGGVLVGRTYEAAGGNAVTRLPADTVVFVSINRPNRALHDALSAVGRRARIVGDANSPRQLGAAIREGWHAGATV